MSNNLHTNGTPDKVTPADYGNLHAFPYILQVPNPLNPREIRAHVNQGVTIRDYFAAHALASCYNSWDAGQLDTARDVAEWCYRIADAMLIARQRELRK